MKEQTKGYLGGLVTGGGFGALVMMASLDTCDKLIMGAPVQAGYAKSSQLEIDTEDLDGNGKNELILRYEGTNYLLTLDAQNKPQIESYSIRPTEVVKGQ